MEHHSAKRKRLSYACNHCRLKKTRCDEQQPSCRNCRIAGVQCITTDKRRAGAVVAHRRRSTAGATPETQAINTPLSQSEPSPLPSTGQRSRQSAQCWDRSGWRSGRLPMMPRFVGGCMFEIMTEWLDLAFYRLRIAAPYPSFSSIGATSQSISVPQTAPALPALPDMRILGQHFLQTVGCIFPFLPENQINQLCDCHSQISPSDQALTYLIATIGLMTDPESHQTTISSYTSHCNTLLGHIVTERTLHSIQAILLLSIILRGTDQITWAWDILSLGISMAQSTGINQTPPPEQANTDSPNTWWCIYVFEKILAFESGRTSTIWDRDLSRPIDSNQMPAPASDERYKWSCISLANTLHEMQERAAGAWRREEWLPQSVDEAIEEKVRTGGELAMLLDGWWRGIPSEFQPGSVSISDQGSQQSAFLSFYYHYALILLNRSSLLIEPSEIHEVIERYGTGKPWRSRVANGPTLCVEAAREMVKLTVRMIDSGLPTYLTTLASPLTAVYVLAVHILRERRSLLIRADFELMKAGIAVIRRHYGRLEGGQRVDDVLSALEGYAGDCLQGQVPLPFGTDHSLSSSTDPIMMNGVWGPSALDWAGWDWNDLSHLFENGE